MPSPEVERVNELQKLIQSGQEPPLEVMQAAIRALREERGYAGEVKATKVRKAKEIAQIDIAELFKPKEKS